MRLIAHFITQATAGN